MKKSIGRTWDKLGTTGQILMSTFVFYFICYTFGG